MDILAIIPARYQSTRFPGKPLVIIDGKSMIQRVWEQVSKASNRVIIATDDERISKTVTSFGGIAIMTDEQHQTGTDRCAEALLNYQDKYNKKIDIVINVQGDEPFIDPTQINEISAIFDKPGIEIATLVKKISGTDELFDPNKPKVVFGNDSSALYFSRNPIPYIQKEEKENWLEKHTFYKHIGMYAYRSDVLLALSKLGKGSLEKAESLEQLRWLEAGYIIKVAITKLEAYSVDNIKDLEKIKEAGLLKSFRLPPVSQ